MKNTTGRKVPRGARKPWAPERRDSFERQQERELRWKLTVLGAAHHEASHAVAQFALENPRGPLKLVIAGPEGVVNNTGLAQAYYQHQRLPVGDIPSVEEAWIVLAGTAGEYLHSGWPHGLRRDPDHRSAAQCLMPWHSGSFLHGQIGDALRFERRNVEQLLRENWHVVKRVAAAAAAKRTLEDAELRSLIETDDLVKVCDSSVWEPFSASQDKYMGLYWERRGGRPEPTVLEDLDELWKDTTEAPHAS